MNSKRLSMNVIANLFAFLLNFLIGFYLSPYILSTLGTEAYGFITLANNIISYINIISTALNAFAGRFISMEYFVNDFKKANYYLNSILAANILLSSIIFLPVCLLIVFIQYIINIPTALISDVKWLFVVIAINYIITLIGTTFTVGTFVKNRLDLDAFRRMISIIIKALLIVGLFILFDGSIVYVAIGTLVASLYVIVANSIYTKRLAPELHVNLREASPKAVREVVSLGIWHSVNNAGNTLNSGLDILFANWFFSAMQMGCLSVGKTVSNMFTLLFSSISSVFNPTLLKLYSENKSKELEKQLNYSIRFLSFFSSVLFAGFWVFGMDFLKLWVPDQDNELIYKLSLIILLGDLIPTISTPLYYVNTLTKNMKIPSFVTIICGISNVIGMLILIKVVKMNIYAIVLTTLVVNIIVNFIFVPIYAAHQLQFKKTAFYMSFLRCIASSVLNICEFAFLYKFVNVNSWLTLIIFAIVFTIIGSASNVVTLLNYEEKRKLVNLVRTKLSGNSDSDL